MLLHHVLGNLLFMVSYPLNFISIGSVFTFLHDFTDVFVDLMKISVVIGNSPLIIFFYTLMITSWLYFRLYYYPVYIIYEFYTSQGSSENLAMRGFYPLLMSMFILL